MLKNIFYLLMIAGYFSMIYMYISKRGYFCSLKDSSCDIEKEKSKARLVISGTSLILIIIVILFEVYF